MARRFEDFVPPWQDGRSRLRKLAISLAALTLYSLFFLNDYTTQRSTQMERLKLFGAPAERVEYNVNFIGLQPFWTMARVYVSPLPILAAILLCSGVVANYRHYRSGVRSDYTMRRLRDPWEYHRRCIALPALEALLCLLLFALLTGIYYWIYLHFTPAELLLPVGQRFGG